MRRGCGGPRRLKNGNTLMSLGLWVREVNAKGETVWQFSASDIPDYKVTQFQLATRLSNGNTLINNWVNQWSTKIDPATAPAQAWEISPDKKVVWVLRSWLDPMKSGPATTIQLLDEPGAPEDVRFGEIK